MVYSDVVNNGWILPYKEKYTMRDFNRLRKEHCPTTARWIIVCSAVYYWDKGGRKDVHTCEYSKVFDDVEKFKLMDMTEGGKVNA